MRFPRSSGILLHITSLPGPFGIGDLGPEAIKFLDFLDDAGQRLWQVLPLGPPSLGNSPYSCYSAFAGSPLLISPEQLSSDGWLEASEVIPLGDPDANDSTVDYESAAAHKCKLLDAAFQQSRDSLRSNESFAEFCEAQSGWLNDFARFEALMRHFGHARWTQWPIELVHRNAKAIVEWDEQLADQIEYSKFVQFVFDQQWNRIKKIANERGIRIFGDMPIFVAHESADVWANQSLFCLDEHGERTVVAGVPPDYFSETGQLWGNPLYRWDVMESNGFAWWTARFQHALQQFDLLRVDHFRGFESYWEIPATAATAIDGQWKSGPKEKPFEAARKQLGELPIVAEDLGMITKQVHELRKKVGFPAMRVLQFGFSDPDDVFHRPDHYPKHSVAYTGTHDNDTLMGWYAKQTAPETSNGLVEFFVNGDEAIHLQLIKAVLDSNSDTVILPMQDLLGLGSETRMNTPGQAAGNWRWRATDSCFPPGVAAELRKRTIEAGR